MVLTRFKLLSKSALIDFSSLDLTSSWSANPSVGGGDYNIVELMLLQTFLFFARRVTESKNGSIDLLYGR